MDDFIPIKNIMNELYAKDISRKVRSAHNTRAVSYTHLDVYKRQEQGR